MKIRLMTAALMLMVAAGFTGAAKFSTVPTGPTRGAWATTDKGAVAALYADEQQGAVVGFYRDQRRNPKACDFSIGTTSEGVNFQVVDELGKIHTFPATDLLRFRAAAEDLDLLKKQVKALRDAMKVMNERTRPAKDGEASVLMNPAEKAFWDRNLEARGRNKSEPAGWYDMMAYEDRLETKAKREEAERAEKAIPPTPRGK